MTYKENFTKRIAVENDFTPEFFFNRVHIATGNRYYVSVLNKDGHNYLFTMELESGCWKITNSQEAPDWVLAIEKKLEEAILES